MYKYFYFILLIFYLFSCTPPCNILEPRECCNITWEMLLGVYKVNRNHRLTIRINNEDNISHENITIVSYFPDQLEFISSSLPILFYKREKQSSVTWKIEKIEPLKSVDIEMEIKVEVADESTTAFYNFIQILKNNMPVYIEGKYLTFYGIGIGRKVDINFYDTEDPCEIGTPTTYYIGIKKNEFIHTPITNFSFGIYIPQSMVISSIKSPSQYTIENHIIKFVPVERLDYQEMKHEITCIPTLPGIVTTEIYMKYDEQTDKDYKTSVEYTTVYDPVTQIKKPTCYSGWHPLPKP